MLHFLSEILIGFQPSTYTITEGLSVSVCAVMLDGASAITITVPVSITGGTAEG